MIDKLVGNASQATKKEVEQLVGPILVPGETITHAYHVGVRDKLVFTSLRFVFIDTKGVTGKKVTTSSYPWKSVNFWETTTAGHVDTNGELLISVRGQPMGLVFSFGNSVNIRTIANIVSAHVLT